MSPPQPAEPATRKGVVVSFAAAVVTAVISLAAPGLTEKAISTLGHIVADSRPCGSNGPSRYTEGEAHFTSIDRPVRAERPVRLLIPGTGRCHVIFGMRRPDNQYVVHGECANPSDIPGEFACEWSPSKLCGDHSGKTSLNVWLGAFVVSEEGLTKLVASGILKAGVPAAAAGYEDFAKILGRDNVARYVTENAVWVQCLNSAG